jgi:ATP-dependent Lon protease
VIAAHRAGIRRVMLPARNRKDFEDIPQEARDELEFIWLERVDEAIASALEPKVRANDGGSDKAALQLADAPASGATGASQLISAP